MSNKLSIKQRAAKIEAITPRLTRWVEAQQGSGLILFYWLFITSFIATLVLFCLGIAHSNAWLFFGGIVSLRLFAYLFRIGNSFLTRIDPQ